MIDKFEMFKNKQFNTVNGIMQFHNSINESDDLIETSDFLYTKLDGISKGLDSVCDNLWYAQTDGLKKHGYLKDFDINNINQIISELQNFVKNIENSGLLDTPNNDEMVLNINPSFLLNVRKTVAKYKNIKQKNEILRFSYVDCKGMFSGIGKFKTSKFKNISNVTKLNYKIENFFASESNLNDDSLWKDIVDFCKPIKITTFE